METLITLLQAHLVLEKTSNCLANEPVVQSVVLGIIRGSEHHGIQVLSNLIRGILLGISMHNQQTRDYKVLREHICPSH